MASGDTVFQHTQCAVLSSDVSGAGVGGNPGLYFKFVLQGGNNIAGTSNLSATFDGAWVSYTSAVSMIVDPLKTYDIVVKEH